eukprot:2158462-Pyramimonas_sp.AAC.1
MIFSVDPGATTPFLDRAFVRQCLLSGAARAKLGSLVDNYSVASCDPGGGAENAARKRKKRVRPSRDEARDVLQAAFA